MTLDPQGCMHSGFHKLCNFDIRRHHNLWYHGIQGENDSTVHVYCTLYSTGQNTDVKKSLSLEHWCFCISTLLFWQQLSQECLKDVMKNATKSLKFRIMIGLTFIIIQLRHIALLTTVCWRTPGSPTPQLRLEKDGWGLEAILISYLFEICVGNQFWFSYFL